MTAITRRNTQITPANAKPQQYTKFPQECLQLMEELGVARRFGIGVVNGHLAPLPSK